MIKTVTLTGKEAKVTDLKGFYATVHNLSGEAVYASSKPNIKAGADFVAEIPSGAAKMITLDKGTIYLLGSGKVELTGQDSEFVNFSQSSQSGSVGGTSDVTRAYVDMQDALNLEAAKAYADTVKENVEQKLSETEGRISENTENISALQDEKADRSELSETLSSANTYTDLHLSKVNGSVTELQNTKANKSDIPAISNPNLLDNWYFADPINQRGQTEYTGGYTIDRWALRTSGSSLSIEDGYISVQTTNSDFMGNAVMIVQKYEQRVYPGEIYTLSFLVKSVTGSPWFRVRVVNSVGAYVSHFYGGILKQGLNTVTETVPLDGYKFDIEIDAQAAGGICGVELIAAKLEIGDKQTLARKEGEAWVLNDPPPNKASELAKCQRYQVVIGGKENILPVGMCQARSDTKISLQIPLPAELRATPSISLSGSQSLTFRNQNTAIYATEIAQDVTPAPAVTLVNATVEGAIPGAVYEAFLNTKGCIIIDANL